jgi:PAT family beta-lactamase induction signal transducer AmpG
MGRALFVSGLLMMFSNLLFAVLASVGHSPLMLALAVGTENLTSGIGLTVFVTYLSGLSNLAYTATQFALLSSFAAAGRTWLATPSGQLAEGLGWVGFWLFTVVAAVPGMILLWILWQKGFVVESLRAAKEPPDVTPTDRPVPEQG